MKALSANHSTQRQMNAAPEAKLPARLVLFPDWEEMT